jgi:hypothetical protein
MNHVTNALRRLWLTRDVTPPAPVDAASPLK